MAVDSSAWWPGGLTTANPFCKNKTRFQWSDVGRLLGSPCTTEHQAHTKRLESMEVSELVFLPPSLFHSMNRNDITDYIFSDCASKRRLPQSQGKTRDLGVVPSWQMCTSAVILAWFIFKNNLFYDTNILQREKKFTLGAGLGQSSERPGKIQSENSLAGFPQWLFPLQCQQNDKFTLTHSHTHKRNPRKVKKRTMESPYFFQSINLAWMTAKTCNFIGFPKSISSPRSEIL